MKWWLFFFTFVPSFAAFSQASPENRTNNVRFLSNANDAAISVSPLQSPAFQAQNWKEEKERNPANASAWLNYYLWTERDKQLSQAAKTRILRQTYLDAKKFIGQSAPFFLLQYLQSNKKDTGSLNKAFSSAGDKSWLYPYMVQHAIVAQDRAQLLQYAKEMEATSPLPAALYEYHYNVLQSADSNAVVYARGLNDLVPLAVVQQAHNIRKDVQLRYYEDKIASGKNVYLCLSLGREVVSKYPYASYSGLLIKTESSNMVDEIKKHVGAFAKKYLDNKQYMPQEVAQLYKNYLPSFLLLYRYYRAKNNPAAAEMEKWMQAIAEKAGIKEQIIGQMKR